MLMLRIYFSLFTLLVGSFLNAVIYRVPRGINIAYPRSSCISCKSLIKWYQNIPVFSYFFLRGRCANCGVKISLEYPLVELFTAVVGFLLFPTYLSVESICESVLYFSIFCCFLCHFIIDIKHYLLPDSINLYLAANLLILGILKKSFWEMGVGALIGFLFPYLVSLIFLKLKGVVGLGGGDIKLWAALGIFLGPLGILHNIFLSCFIGSLVGGILLFTKKMSKSTPIPFGPFIILIAAFQLFFTSTFNQLIGYIS